MDESDRNGMRAVIKLKKDADAKKILSYLYKNTSLETSFGINMVAIAHGKPCQLGLLDIISYYVNYQREVILRRSKFDLERAKERAHILEGLIIAVRNIDEVIKIIKTAENTADARAKLRARFDLTEVQATAILDLRLARLTKLEVYKLEEELAELKKKIEELTALVASKPLQMGVVRRELLEIKKKYKTERRSHVIGASEAEDIKTNEEESLRPIEDFYICYTAGGTVKKTTERNFNQSERKVKENSSASDFITFAVKACSDMILFAFTNLGNAFKVSVDSITECRYRDKGVKFSDVFKDSLKNERPVAFFACENDKMPDGNLLFYTKNGLIKRSEWKEYAVNKQTFAAIKLKDDEVIGVETDIPDTTIAFITEYGLVLNTEKTDVPVQGRMSGGVKGINLNKGDSIKFVSQVDEEGEFVLVTDTGYYKKVVVSEIEPSARYRKGVKICELGRVNKIVYADYVKEPYDFAVIDNFGVAFSLNTEDVAIESRTTKGKTLKNENKKRLPEKVYRII